MTMRSGVDGGGVLSFRKKRGAVERTARDRTLDTRPSALERFSHVSPHLSDKVLLREILLILKLWTCRVN